MEESLQEATQRLLSHGTDKVVESASQYEVSLSDIVWERIVGYGDHELISKLNYKEDLYNICSNILDRYDFHDIISEEIEHYAENKFSNVK